MSRPDVWWVGAEVWLWPNCVNHQWQKRGHKETGLFNTPDIYTPRVIVEFKVIVLIRFILIFLIVFPVINVIRLRILLALADVVGFGCGYI